MNQAQDASTIHVPKVFVVCDQTDTGPVWGYILGQHGLIVILETLASMAIDRWSIETPDLAVIDVDIDKQDPIVLCRKFRDISVAPILLLLPVYNETRILDAYAAGVDDVIVKPISPPIFLAKIMTWVRRSWNVPAHGLSLVSAGGYQLDPARRCIIGPEEVQIKLTNLEFRLLLLLMSKPSQIFITEDIIQSIWGGFGSGDPVVLKNVVYRLRKKIEPDPGHPVHLQTWGGGYSFQG